MLLQTLEERLATLRQRCAPLAQHATLSARFDRHLFRTRSTLLQGYLEEADANLAALRQAVKHEQLPQVAWLAEHLASQLERYRMKPPPGRCASGTPPRQGLAVGSADEYSIRSLNVDYWR